MIKIDYSIEQKEIVMDGSVDEIYAEIGVALRILYEAVEKVDGTDFAKNLIEILAESTIKSEKEIDEEMKQFEADHPDEAEQLDNFINTFWGGKVSGR